MSEVERRRALRDDYIVAVYELSQGDPLNWVSHVSIAEESGMPTADVMTVGQQVAGDHLVEFKTMGGIQGLVAITPMGTRRAEQIILDRDGAGEPRYTSVVILSDAELVRALEPLVGQIRQALDAATEVDPQVRADLGSDLALAEAQLRANEPNRGVIRASLDRIKKYSPTIVGLAALGANIVAIIHGL